MSIQQNRKKSAFTLLEVLVTLAILSIVFIALIQGQGDNLYIINIIQKRQLAQKYIRAKLYAIERQEESVINGAGVFSSSHELVGQRWNLSVFNQEVFGIPLRRLEYTIEIIKRGQKSKVLGVIYVE